MTNPYSMRCPIQTHRSPYIAGTWHDLLNPVPERIDIREVAYHLARINRFVGASEISVAQHCVEGAEYILERWTDIATRSHGRGASTTAALLREGTAYAFLLHDAHEAIVGDVSSPAKRAMHAIQRADYDVFENPWRKLENMWAEAFATRFELDRVAHSPGIVHQVDMKMGREEAEVTFHQAGDLYGPEMAHQVMVGSYTVAQAEGNYLRMYKRLATALGLTVHPTGA